MRRERSVGKVKRDMRIIFAVFAFSFFFAQFATGQAAPNAITNSDVISMTKAGIGEQTIILAIQRGPDKFDTSPQALIALKRAGVSDQVLNAVLSTPSEANSEQKGSQSQPPPQSVQQPSPQENSQPSIAAGELPNYCSPHTGETFVASAARTTCCEKGFGSACSNLARFYETGTQGLPTDLPTADELRKIACEKGEGEDCSGKISDLAERTAFEKAIALTDPIAKTAALESFLQSYPLSAAKGAVLNILTEIKLHAAANASAPQTQSPTTIQRARQPLPEGLSLRVLQEQSVPYTQESGGGISTSCNIIGTANTSAYVNAYGNGAYGNATTNSNQHMTCRSYDTTIRWPHVLNVMFAQASDGNSYLIACDRAWRWSKCVPLRAGDVFSAHFTGKGIEVQAVNSKGREEGVAYSILQSKAWR
jgi:hypothetical protein